MTTTPTTPPPSDDPSTRRPMAAGLALFVIIAALLAGLLLNSADILRTAQRQEQGWMRTIGIALMEPVHDVSHLLYLDRPRAVLDDALGRRTAAPEPAGQGPTPSTPTTTTSAPTVETTTITTVPMPTRRTVDAGDPLILYIGGDSMVGQFGPMLQNRAGDSGMVESEVVYEFESGLSRPDFVDWPQRLARVQEDLDPDVFVLFFGGNDAQAIFMPDGTWIDFGTPAWDEEYRRRVDDVMTQLEEGGDWAYWMGMPVVRSETFLPKVRLMNSIYEDVASEHPMVEYVPSWEVFEGPDGGYSEYLTNADGDLVDMRLDDGIHLTTNGGIRLAEVTYQRIAEDWGLPGA